MPGFNIGGFGGDQTSNLVEPRRTHRWVFATIGRGQGQFSRAELLLLKTASRPKFKFTEAKMDHNQEEVYFAGKQAWEPIELTWYDIEQNPDVSLGIYKWLGSVVDLQAVHVAHPRSYKQVAVLAMLNGFGLQNEEWTMYGTWPMEVDWKGLDYSSSEIQTCAVKMRFDRATRSCRGLIGVSGIDTNMC